MLLLASALLCKTIVGAGSSLVYPLMSRWTYEYERLKGVKINYQSIGSGAGIRQTVAGTVDFGVSDLPLSPDELDKNRLVQFPIVVAPVAVVYNLNVKKLKLPADILADIFLGKIRRWDDERIRKINPDTPSLPIVIVRRTDGSGTTWIFTKYLSGISDEWSKKIGYGKVVKWPVGIGAKGSEGVASYVKMTNGAIGYVGWAYVKHLKLKYAEVESRGKFFSPKRIEIKKVKLGKHFSKDIVFMPESYPLVNFVWILMKREELGKIKDFISWCLKEGDKFAEALDYVPLPKWAEDEVIKTLRR